MLSPNNMSIGEYEEHFQLQLALEISKKGADNKTVSSIEPPVVSLEPEPEYDIENKTEIDVLRVKLPRQTIQGGLSNDEYNPHNLTDWRLLHHIPTNYVRKWKRYQEIKTDSKFTDLCDKSETDFSEGKNLKGGLNLNPSKNVGSGRKYDQKDLEECFKLNGHYFLYDFGEITDTTIVIIIYWIHINIIKEWYYKCGNGKGNISGTNIIKCIKSCNHNITIWDRTH